MKWLLIIQLLISHEDKLKSLILLLYEIQESTKTVANLASNNDPLMALNASSINTLMDNFLDNWRFRANSVLGMQHTLISYHNILQYHTYFPQNTEILGSCPVWSVSPQGENPPPGCHFLWQMSFQWWSQKLLQRLVPHKLTDYISDFDLFLTEWSGHLIKMT